MQMYCVTIERFSCEITNNLFQKDANF